MGWLRRMIGHWTGAGKDGRHALVGRAELWEMKRAFQLQFLTEAGLRAGHYLLDIGCGTLRGGIPLIEYLDPGHYVGVEGRAHVLDEGRRELREAGLENRRPTLIASEDLSTLVLPMQFDRAWAFSVFIHMSDEVLGGCLSSVQRWLRPDGACYANVRIGEGEDGAWQGFPVVTRPYAFYERIAARNGLAVADLGTLASVGHHSGVERQDRQRMLEFTPVSGSAP